MAHPAVKHFVTDFASLLLTLGKYIIHAENFIKRKFTQNGLNVNFNYFTDTPHGTQPMRFKRLNRLELGVEKFIQGLYLNHAFKRRVRSLSIHTKTLHISRSATFPAICSVAIMTIHTRPSRRKTWTWGGEWSLIYITTRQSVNPCKLGRESKIVQ